MWALAESNVLEFHKLTSLSRASILPSTVPLSRQIILLWWCKLSVDYSATCPKVRKPLTIKGIQVPMPQNLPRKHLPANLTNLLKYRRPSTRRLRMINKHMNEGIPTRSSESPILDSLGMLQSHAWSIVLEASRQVLRQRSRQSNHHYTAPPNNPLYSLIKCWERVILETCDLFLQMGCVFPTIPQSSDKP